MLPILDFRKYRAEGAARAEFLTEIRETARELGFFYLSGHGIPDAVIAQARDISRSFFALPDAQKRSIQMVKSPQFRGYNGAGLEHTQGKKDWREQVDIGPEEPLPAADPTAPAWARLIGPNQWPDDILPEMREILLTYQKAVLDLGIEIVRALALSLGQPADVFEPIYTGRPNYLLKVVRYPGTNNTDSDQGVGAHKDSGFVTVLLQDRIGGLQVKGKDGWIDAPPIEGTFVINIGELLEMATNGFLLANVHRVVSPAGDQDRLSIPFFLGARFDAVVPVLDLPPDLAARTRGVTQDPDNPLFREVAKNYLKSRLRSHPDVAQAHHADLLDPETRKGPVLASAY